MGTDDIFRKRKQKSASELNRLRKQQPSLSRFLIVCEGQKTEPYYFDDLRARQRLRTLRIVPSTYGSSPVSVIRCATDLYNEDSKRGLDSYDKVFCVIDRDSHSEYNLALKLIDELKSKGEPFFAIPSNPCFEYWLLLHFRYTRQSFHASSKKSICEAVIHELKKQTGFSKYVKGERGIYTRLEDRIFTAIRHAQRAEEDAEKTGDDNPTTSIAKLVIELQSLAKMNIRDKIG